MSWTPSPHISTEAKEALLRLANSGQSESVAVAECLSDIADSIAYETGHQEGKASDIELACSCFEIRMAARDFALAVLMGQEKWRELPGYTRDDWLEAVNACETDAGYEDWVTNKVLDEADE